MNSVAKKPLVIGITGGIGSGKSTVCKVFEFLGIPNYNADKRAAILQNSHKSIINETIELLGSESYNNDKLNKDYIRQRIFSDSDLLLKINKIVHPRIKEDFMNWENKNQQFPYLLKESAILFESNAYKQCDKVITVTADKNTRINRILKRDKLTRSQIESIIEKQWTDSDKIELSDFVIDNNGRESMVKQVMKIHDKLIKLQ